MNSTPGHNRQQSILVWCVMGDSKRCCANWSKSMKFGTLIDFHMLYPNLPGAKASSQWCHHLGRFKMAACQKQIFPLCVKKMLNNYKQNHFSAVFGIKESKSGIWFTVVWTGIPLFKKCNTADSQN